MGAIEEVGGAIERRLTADEVKADARLIQEVMEAVMVENTHYGVIPGTDKPTLYKAGAEKIMATFRLVAEPEIEDLSTLDCARYLVRCRITTREGTLVGIGVGECSTDEEKFKWRGAICDAEYDAAPDDRRRIKYYKNGDTSQQVRTDPPDKANTVLKIAKKRGLIDGVLTATAASDIFVQDLEDLDGEGGGAAGARKPDVADPKPKGAGNGDKRRPPGVISEAQRKRLYAIAYKNGFNNEDVKAHLGRMGIESANDIGKDRYEAIVEAFSAPPDGEAPEGDREPGQEG